MAIQSAQSEPSRGGPVLTQPGFRADGLGGGRGERAVEGCWFVRSDDPDPSGRIGQLMKEHAREGSCWAVLLSYELGGWVEPHARSSVHDPLDFPLAVLMRLGEPIEHGAPLDQPFTFGEIRSEIGRDGYLASVRRVGEYIAAGDIYQANIAHKLTCRFDGDPAACASALTRAAAPRYGATMRFCRAGISHTICSISPELFVRVDREQGRIKTEPMKGTRPFGVDASELEHSDKDRAELNMITDLMRNDIGRVCTLGSVRVHTPRRIEPHPSGVLQASSVIEGHLRDDVDVTMLIRAIFPPGSITGAPKVRAMQIIDELEQAPRRSYCGSMMHIDEHGNIEASVAIRTAHIWGDIDPDCPSMVREGRFEYPVGAGIVADSDPASEWAETLVKASVLERLLGVDLSAVG
ncbi:MAG: anthranilate synthase component I family protein [Phycisphaerales bacterium]